MVQVVAGGVQAWCVGSGLRESLENTEQVLHTVNLT
jgi:hypothetical protein